MEEMAQKAECFVTADAALVYDMAAVKKFFTDDVRGHLARLREILAGLRIPADLERIGDYAANVAKRSIALNTSPPLPHVAGLRALGLLAAGQVRQALRAYREGYAELALQVRENDARLDEQYTGLFRELLTYMMEDPRNITPCTHLLFMATNLRPRHQHRRERVVPAPWRAAAAATREARRQQHHRRRLNRAAAALAGVPRAHNLRRPRRR